MSRRSGHQNHTVPLSTCKHLIIVCCHAIYIGGPALGRSENEWCIEPFQRGETSTFVEHARKGIELLAEDSGAILIFSGGATKPDRTSLSEGQSYVDLVQENGFFGYEANIDPQHIIAETHATDSYQNVLFSLLKFRLYTGCYPAQISVVTHDFKRQRFVECHFPAIGYFPLVPDARRQQTGAEIVNLIGIDPPEDVTARATLIVGEEKRGLGLWRRDLYGVAPELASKRRQRGWKTGTEKDLFLDVGLERAVEDLILWDGGQTGNDLFPDMARLPWSR